MTRRRHHGADTPDGAASIDLPEGWAWASLSDATTPVPNIRPDDEPDREFRYADISSVSNQSFRVTEPKSFLGSDAPSRARRPVQPFDTLFSNVRTYLRNIALVDETTVVNICSTGFTVLRPNGAVDPQFLFRYTLTDVFIDAVTPQQTGTHYPATSDRVVLSQRIPLPPLAEQRRIVEKVEALLARVNAARERLARVPTILKRFRQSVLAAACSGQLTADWREGNPQAEPARVLLQRISEFRARSGQAKSSKPRADGDYSEDDGSIASVTELPDTWSLCHVCDIATVCLGGTPSRKEPAYWGGRLPWVSSGEVANSRICQTTECITKRGLDESNAKVCPRSTVLIAMIGEGKTRGQTAILDVDACTNQNVAALVFDAGNVDPEYVWRWALGEYEKNRAGGRGGNYPALNGRIVRRFRIPLPPLPEQHEVVRHVGALFKLTDAIEARVTAAIRRVENVTQAILAKAFRGELVPTEAELARREGRDYEPASVLLERIRAVRAMNNGNPASTTRRGRRDTLRSQVSEMNRDEKNGDAEEPDFRVAAAPKPKRNTTAPAPIDETERDDVMAVIREVFASGGLRDRQQAIQDIATALVFQRVGSRIAQYLDDDIRTAVRRGVLENSPDGLRLLTRSITDYDRKFLVTQLLADLGTTWWNREDVITAIARRLGFRRTGAAIRAALKSAINSALRRGLLESDGPRIRCKR